MDNPENNPQPRWLVPAILTLALLAARAFAAPILADPTGGAVPATFELHTPLLYLIFAPVFATWDAITLLSMERLKGLLWGVALLYLVRRLWALRVSAAPAGRRAVRELWVLTLSLAGFVLFVLAGIVWHRPMLALDGTGTDQIVVDLHSHTNVSHDVKGTLMGGYDVEASRRWHARAGFDAFYVTDHNTTAGWKADPVSATSAPFVCPGIEVSAWRAHIVLLGDTTDVVQAQYDGSLERVQNLLRDSRARYGALAIASLPEYNRAFWPVLDSLVEAGVAGFEIVNASPKAADFSLAHRDSIIGLARSRRLLLAGVSDGHGWGATSLTWMVVDLPGWRALPSPCPALLARLAQPDPGIQIVERHHLTPEAWWPRVLTPIGALWEEWRSESWLVTVSWGVWIWLAALMGNLVRGKK